MTELQQSIIDGLMEDCHVCEGSGKYEGSLRRDRRCYRCDGEGKSTSEFGDAIFKFITDNINKSRIRLN